MRRCLSWTIGLVLLCTGLGACLSPRPPTQVTVYVEAQPLVRAETRRLEVSVLAGPRGNLSPLADSYAYDGENLYPRDFTLVPLGGDLSRIFELEATAYDASRRVITVVRVRAGFTANVPRTIRLTLEDRCRGITCPPGATCRAGRCEQLVDPSADAGVDLDAGVVPSDAPSPPCASNAECDDDVYCNGREICRAGVCGPGALVDCDDHVSCTEDVCSGGGCNHLPNPALCTAGPDPSCDPTNGCQYSTCNDTICVSDGCITARCSGPSLCVREFGCSGATPDCCGGRCVATNCDDGSSCTADFCDETARGGAECVNTPTTGRCDDGDVCTTGETCTATECRGGVRDTCDDMNPCTDDSCDAAAGCVHFADDTNTFDDGNACTTGDHCSGGMGVPGSPIDCNDGIACTVDSCAGGACVNTPNDALCVAGPAPRCDPTAGCQYGSGCSMTTCVATDACELATCSGPTCMRTPLCGGLCCGGACCADDGNPCTDAACVGGACGVVNHTRTCDDGNPCTNGDTCSGGACRGTEVVCPVLPCRTNTCESGTCVARPAAGPCDLDADLCTEDTCIGGACTAGPRRSCTDPNPCTDDRCVPTTGACEFPASTSGAPCGFGTGCDASTCDGTGRCVPFDCPGADVCCEDGECRRPGECGMGCAPPLICE